MGKKTLDPIYCKRILRQLKLTDEEIEILYRSSLLIKPINQLSGTNNLTDSNDAMNSIATL